jgi:antitoxin ParD1/3/4
MADVTLSPDLESFARGCVASGRYADLAEVVGAALRLLRAREEEAEAFRRSLDEALAEAEEHGFVEWEEVEAELDAIIAEAEAEHAARSAR